jgi:hypothetical protein
MTSHQEATEKMSLSSVTFLNDNTAITGTFPDFAIYFSIVQATNAQIQVAQVQQEADKSGDITTKKELKLTLIAQATEVSRRVVAYATNVNNNALRVLVNYTESDLKKSSEQKLISSCQVIYDNANAHVTELGTYGINIRSLDWLQTLITNFSNTIPKGRVDTTDSGEATRLLASLFKTLSANWAKIDTLVEMVKTSQPNFYNEYQKVRKIIETGKSSLPLRIKAINAETGAPEANVTLTLIPTSELSKAAAATGKSNVVKKTAAGGGSNYKSVPDGTYTVEAEKPGFKKVIETVNVVHGELTVLEIKMEKA